MSESVMNAMRAGAAEIARLREENDKLKAEIESLRKEVDELRDELIECKESLDVRDDEAE